MLFLIQWLGGVYCAKKMGTDGSWVWIASIFIGWLFIIFYILDNLGRNTSTSANSYTSPTYSTTASNDITRSITSAQNDSKCFSGSQNAAFFTKVVGVTFENRQNYVRQCYTGQQLELVRDKLNPYDKNAIAIYSGNNQVGFLSKEIAAQLAPQMDNGMRFICEVAQVTGGSGKIYGWNIKISYP